METSCFIGQPLALDALQGAVSTGHVIYPEPFPVGVPEIELGQIAMQMRLADMEVAAGDAALQDREIVFNAVGMGMAADIFLGTVVHNLMPEMFAHVAVLPVVIGAKEGGGIDLSNHDGVQIRSGDAGNVH